MKIIFLDFDGVLNSEDFFDSEKLDFEEEIEKADEENENSLEILSKLFDPDAIKILNIIIEENNADIVLSTAWVNHYSLPFLRKLLIKVGLKGKVLGATPRKMNNTRGNQIKNWIVDHISSGKKLEGFVILEDYFPLSFFFRVVRTDARKGIQKRDIERSKRMLDYVYTLEEFNLNWRV